MATEQLPWQIAAQLGFVVVAELQVPWHAPLQVPSQAPFVTVPTPGNVQSPLQVPRHAPLHGAAATSSMEHWPEHVPGQDPLKIAEGTLVLQVRHGATHSCIALRLAIQLRGRVHDTARG